MTPAQSACTPVAVGIERLILDFLAYLELERGLSRNTLEAYRFDLLQFGEFLDRRGLTVEQTAHGDLAAFLSELSGGARERPPVAPSTIARKVACLRSFYRHLRREGTIEHDPTAELRGPRKARRLPRVLSRDEVARLIAQPRGAGRSRCATAPCWRPCTRAACAPRRRSGSSSGTSIWRRGCWRAREGLQGAARPDRPPGGGGAACLLSQAGAPLLVGGARESRGCSSTAAARASHARASTRSSRATRAARAWRRR